VKEAIQLMVDTIPDGFGAVLSDSSINRIQEALEPTDTASAFAWLNWGFDLDVKLGRYIQAEHAYRNAIAMGEAIRLDPRLARAWNGLGNLYCDHLDRPDAAAEAYENALRLDPEDQAICQNRLFLRRDFMGEGPGARQLMNELWLLHESAYPDTTYLHEALFAAYDANWGLACEALAHALTIRAEGFSPLNTDDWLRASAVLLHLNYGAELLAFLDGRGDTARLRPWVEAVRALHLGDRRALQNIAPEVRTTAEIFYDGIESRLKKLPEKTRRRSLPKLKQPRARRR
jgi:tetratricopeptide (TPR) repeat protein